MPELVTGTVKKSKLLGATVLKHRADQLQTKRFVYIWCSSRPKIFVCCCSALCFKTVAQSSLLFLTVPVTSLGPSPQPSTPCQQTFPCCTVCLVWLALGLEKSLMFAMVWQISGHSCLALSMHRPPGPIQSISCHVCDEGNRRYYPHTSKDSRSSVPWIFQDKNSKWSNLNEAYSAVWSHLVYQTQSDPTRYT